MRTGSPRPFTFRADDKELADLAARLSATRWPDDVNDAACGWGVPLPEAQALCAYWRDEFDWRAQEARLFSFPHFIIDVDGLDLHFIHARSTHAGATPLIMTHGWPGSVFEFLGVIERLTQPERFGGSAKCACHVILPSLQGFGFSPPAAEPGMSQAHVARRQAALMAALGYGRYIAQGGDWGAIVSILMGRADPEHCAAVHVNMLPPMRPKDVDDPMALVTDAERAALARVDAYQTAGLGYYHQQSTKPQTLAYGLTDSPAGWCAWVAEKFQAWTDCGGTIANAVSLPDMFSTIALYWLTGTIASSSRFYKEFARAQGTEMLFPLRVPLGVARYPQEILICPKNWAERIYDVIHWYEAPCGGHFAAMEQPDLFARDIWQFTKAVSARL